MTGRLPHGYTNETWAADDGIHKHDVGIDAEARMRTELDAVRALAHLVPTPRILAVDEGRGASVLLAAGRMLRCLHGSATPDGSVVVHGDYGPQNLLFDPFSYEVVAVLDWEFSHRGAAVEDLAWAEWIVRMHHPADVPALWALFEGYGDRPPWMDRRAVMVSRCEGFRLATTAAWPE